MKIENVAVISLEDYAEYQRLKKSKEVDYSRIRVGSEVMIHFNGNHIENSSNENLYYKKIKAKVLINNSKYALKAGNELYRGSYRSYFTFISEGLIHTFATDDYDFSFITEVIEY